MMDLSNSRVAASMDGCGIVRRLNTHVAGVGQRAMLFAHGFGCDQNMWRYVAPAFEHEFRTVLFDYVGAGGSDASAYDAEKYATLEGYADDVVPLAHALDITEGVFVGHSVSAMVGLMAARRAPELFSTLVLVGPSPCYINDGEYVGGFTRDQISELLESSTATTWAGPRPWRRSSWATPIGPSSARNLPRVSAAPIPTLPSGLPAPLGVDPQRCRHLLHVLLNPFANAVFQPE